ncbi:MAG: hypothetical protein AAGJ37_17725 [Pseudomonadota bacterium]
MKNITLSVDEKLIAAARNRAAEENTTLNAKFRVWLEEYVNRQQKVSKAANLVNELKARYSIGGRKFSRDEMNER